MIPIQGIDHINLYVADLARSIEFYCGLFGFDIREDATDESEPWAILGHEGVAFLALHQKDGYRAGHRPGINHWGFNVADFDQLLIELEDRDVQRRFQVEHEGGVIQYPASRSLYLKDPDGHDIELTEVFGGGL